MEDRGKEKKERTSRKVRVRTRTIRNRARFDHQENFSRIESWVPVGNDRIAPTTQPDSITSGARQAHAWTDTTPASIFLKKTKKNSDVAGYHEKCCWWFRVGHSKTIKNSGTEEYRARVVPVTEVTGKKTKKCDVHNSKVRWFNNFGVNPKVNFHIGQVVRLPRVLHTGLLPLPRPATGLLSP